MRRDAPGAAPPFWSHPPVSRLAKTTRHSSPGATHAVKVAPPPPAPEEQAPAQDAGE